MATNQALIGRYQGSSWATALGPTVNDPDLDLLQIVDEGVGVVLNVDYTGAVHNAASSPTNGTQIGVFYTRLGSGQSTAAYFADAFVNPLQLDIIQLVNAASGNVAHGISYAGVAY